jgi:hypothetical protein
MRDVLLGLTSAFTGDYEGFVSFVAGKGKTNQKSGVIPAAFPGRLLGVIDS